MKKFLSLLIVCILTTVCAMSFVGCGTNGKDGKDGLNGTNGKDGVGIADTKIENGKLYVKYTNGNDYVELGQVKGENGKDGNTPTIEISSDGYWVIGGIKTQVKAVGKDGTNGNDGKSAYQIWLDNGHEGSEEDFLNWLKGDQGQQGQQGKSAYEIFKEYYPDYTGSEMEWITAVASGDKCALFGHKYDDGVITKQPTKDETGEITYTCSVCKNTNTEELPKLEVPAIYEENGNRYLNFGSYPQTHVSDETVISELNKLTETNAKGYYSYNGEEYAKVTATPYKTGDAYLYSDGTAVKTDSVEWFKVEPIKWRVASHSDETGIAKVRSFMILDISYFYANQESRTIDGTTVYSNNYKYSDLREFLNNGFYNTAFTLTQQSVILTTESDNSMDTTNYKYNHASTNPYVCENTFDKVYALSYSEANSTYFGGNTAVSTKECRLKVTDYAKAKGVYWSTTDYIDCGNWWLRSPNYYNDHTASYVLYGSALRADNVDSAQIGVVPAMRLTAA